MPQGKQRMFTIHIDESGFCSSSFNMYGVQVHSNQNYILASYSTIMWEGDVIPTCDQYGRLIFPDNNIYYQESRYLGKVDKVQTACAMGLESILDFSIKDKLTKADILIYIDNKSVFNALKNPISDFYVELANKLTRFKTIEVRWFERKYNTFANQLARQTLKDNFELNLMGSIQKRFAELYENETHYKNEIIEKDKEIALLRTQNCEIEKQLEVSKNILLSKVNYVEEKALEKESETIYYSEDKLDNEDFILNEVKKYPKIISQISSRLINDPNFILKMLSINNEVLDYIPHYYLDDEEFIKLAIEIYWQAIKYDSRKHRDGENYMFKAVRVNPKSIIYASDRLKNDEAFIIKALRRDPDILKYVDPKFSNSKSVKEEIQKQLLLKPKKKKLLELNHDKTITKVVPVKRDDDFTLQKRKTLRLIYDSDTFRFDDIPLSLRSDREVVIATLERNGLFLEFLSDEYKNDHKVVKIAVAQNGLALEFASNSLKSNKGICQIAVKNNREAFTYVSEKLFSNANFMSLIYGSQLVKPQKIEKLKKIEEITDKNEQAMKLIEYDPKSFQNMTDEQKSDISIVTHVIKTDYRQLKYASKNLKSCSEVALEAVSVNGMLLEWFDDKIKDDYEIVKKAVEQNGKALQFASEYWRNSIKIARVAVAETWESLQYASEKMKNNRSLVLKAIDIDSRAFQYASEELKNDKDIVLEAVKGCGWLLQYASPDMKKDIDVCIEAVRQNPKSIEYVNESIKQEVQKGAKQQSKKDKIKLAV